MTRWILLLVVLFSLWTAPASASTYDTVAHSSCTTDVACGGTGTSLTYPLTVVNQANRSLAVDVLTSCGAGLTAPIPSVTYAGQALTEVTHLSPAASRKMYVFQWPTGSQPTTGTNNVVVTLPSALIAANCTSGTGIIASAAISAYSVDQTTPIINAVTNSGSGTAISATLSGSSSGDLGFDFVCHGTDLGTGSGNTTETKLFNTEGNANESCGTHSAATAAAADTSLSWTAVASDTWIMIGAVFKNAGGTPPVTGTDWYVSPTGSGSTCSSGVPCSVSTGVGVAVAGDRVNFQDGTYTTGSTSVAIVQTVRSGTSSLPITFKSVNQYGANIVVPSNNTANSSNQGFHLVHNYIVVDGFDISGGNGTGTVVTNFGVGIYAAGAVIQNNKIHGMNRLICTNTDPYGSGGIYSEGTNWTAQYNIIYGVGRRYNGESGCAVDDHTHDHGFYVNGGSTITIRNNILYDDNRGWPIQIAGGTINGLNIYNNVMDDNNPLGYNAGQIVLGNNISNANIKNNICNNPRVHCVAITGTPTFSNVIIDHNMTTTSVMTASGACYTGATCTNNLTSATPGFTDAANRVYTLASGSAAINAGVNVGIPYNGSAPDMGRYETIGTGAIGFSTAIVTGNSMDVTLAMNTDVPVLPATGQTGWAVNNSRSVTAAIRKSGTDSIVTLTFDGAACTNVQTWTVAYTPGNVTGNSGQPLNAFTAQSVVNNCAGATPPASVLSQVNHRFYDALYTNSLEVPLSAVGASNTNIPSGTPFAIVTQTDCTVADCAPVGLRLMYSLTPLATGTPGAFTAVPDIMGADLISFYGVTADTTVLNGTVTCCLSGALTPTNGTTQQDASAIPIVDLPQDGSVVHRRVLKLGANAPVGDIYLFKEYLQDGTALGGYTPSGGAKITVSPVGAAIAAPTGLVLVGASSNNIVELVWTPNTDAALAGYKVYQSTTAGVPGTLVATITNATAIAQHHAMTQFRTVVSVAATYYYTVTAFNTGGEESVVSAEVAVVRTGFAARTAR